MSERAVRRIDHINFLTEAPAAAGKALGEKLRLPTSSGQHLVMPTFELTILAAGNATLEVMRMGRPRRETQDSSRQASLCAIVFATADVDRTMRELGRRRIPYVTALPYSGASTEVPAYREFRASPSAPNWRVSVIDAIFTDQPRVTNTPAAVLVRSDSAGSLRAARALGALASHRVLGRVAAPLFSPAMPFVAACEWGHDVPARRAADRARFDALQQGGIGLTGVAEVIVSARDVEAARARWQRLLEPASPDATNRWTLDGGPALRLVAGESDGPTAVVLAVQSLARARDWLSAQNLLGPDVDGAASLQKDEILGLDIRLTESVSHK